MDDELEDESPQKRMIPFRLPVDLVAEVDAARGFESRTAYAVRALRAQLASSQGASRIPTRGEAGGKRASGFTPRPKSNPKKK